MIEKIRSELEDLRDLKYRELQCRIVPTVDPDTIIGVRTPELRKMAKRLSREENVGEFLDDLPHRFFDENQLHAFIISESKDYDQCMQEVCRFLPYVDNWATCDQMSPKVFKKHRTELIRMIEKWIASSETYTVRFGVGMLMEHYLNEDFDPRYLEMAAALRSEEYYVNMMIAWYFATALAKQYESALPFLLDQKLDQWTHNKTIQKCIESNRITKEHKDYLRTLKRKS